MRRPGEHGEVVQPDLAAFPWNDVGRRLVLCQPARRLAAVNDRRLCRFAQDAALAPDGAFEAEAPLFRRENQVARLLELRGVDAVDGMPLELEGGADQIPRVVDQHKWPGLLFRIEHKSPTVRQRRGAATDVETDRAPLVGGGEFVPAIVGWAREFFVEVFEVWNVRVPQRRDEAELNQRRHLVIRRHDDIEQGGTPALELRHHRGVVLVKIDRDLAIELLFEIRDDFRVDVFAPDEQVELLLRGLERERSRQE